MTFVPYHLPSRTRGLDAVTISREGRLRFPHKMLVELGVSDCCWALVWWSEELRQFAIQFLQERAIGAVRVSSRRSCELSMRKLCLDKQLYPGPYHARWDAEQGKLFCSTL